MYSNSRNNLQKDEFIFQSKTSQARWHSVYRRNLFLLLMSRTGRGKRDDRRDAPFALPVEKDFQLLTTFECIVRLISSSYLLIFHHFLSFPPTLPLQTL